MKQGELFTAGQSGPQDLKLDRFATVSTRYDSFEDRERHKNNMRALSGAALLGEGMDEGVHLSGPELARQALDPAQQRSSGTP